MLCPECGETAPPGPLDVRKCAPGSQTCKSRQRSLFSRIRLFFPLHPRETTTPQMISIIPMICDLAPLRAGCQYCCADE